MLRLALLLVLAGCTGDPDSPKTLDTSEADDSSDPDLTGEDSGEPADSGSDIDAFCEEPALATGELEGDAACVEGVCAVAAGEFVMGSVMDRPDECPEHRVSVDAFSIDQLEVTWARFDACVAAGECDAPPEHCRTMSEGWTDGSISDFPVVCVDHSAAQAYCAHAGGRLPTEAEWEKAARGTDGARWPWGAAAPTCDLTNYRFVSWYCHEGTVAVGSYDVTTAWGVQDMAGNVAEWVADHYDAEAYRSTERDNPTGSTTDCHGSVGGDPGPCVDRVIRGGAYNVTAGNLRTSARSRADPGWYDTNLGFRCAY